MGLVVSVNGEFFTKREDAKICVYDHGFLYGDGVFEGIRVYNGRVFRLDEHIERLYISAKSIMLNIPMSQEEVKRLTVETARKTGFKDVYIRLVVSRGIGDLGLDPRKCGKPSIVIIADAIALYPKEKYEQGIKVITCSTRRTRPDSLNCEIKSLNYLNNILAKIETIHYGADEGIMLNDSGYVTEATADNVFIYQKGKLITPPAFIGILEGITRNTVIEIAKKIGYKVVEMPFSVHDIYGSDECFLTGSGAELIPVIEIDARAIGDGKPGKHFKKLLEAYQELTRTTGTPLYEK